MAVRASEATVPSPFLPRRGSALSPYDGTSSHARTRNDTGTYPEVPHEEFDVVAQEHTGVVVGRRRAAGR